MREKTATKLLEGVCDTYDSIAAEFDRSRQKTWSDFVFFEDYIPESPKILDVGCGNGRLLKYFEDVDFESYLGIDISNTIKQKLDKNNIKYPVEQSKNNAKKYNEL